MKKNNKLRNTIFLSALALVIIVSLLPLYVKKALFYTTPDIDDYKIFANRVIKIGDYEPWQKSEEYNKHQIPADKLHDIEKLKTVALFIAQDNKILHEQYWDDYDENSISNSFSVAKSIVSLMIGIAVEEGKIESIDDPVGKYVKHFNSEKNMKLTIKDLLTMSSGLNWDESYSSPFSLTTEAYYGDSLPKLINQLDVVETPGKTFKYLSGNTELLAMVLSEATGKNISDYMSEKIWSKIGAHNDALWSLDSEGGFEKAYCCFNSNAPDFARIGQLVLNKGSWKGQRIISERYIEESFTAASYLKDKHDKPVDFYGLQWWIAEYKGHKVPYARGILGQYIIVIPDKQAVIVRLGEKRSKKKIDHHPTDIFTYLDIAFGMLK
ncbi:serine hydrolase domain-containing protein [Aureibacter tunicatorum]|uniref:CubicO group peptidase (Beta-lactamase class C family) n=1 Tax=Aureibacter tunicatorum TaxID=866807 RepID=A0AAE4BTR8_9BACT|nr:serine hydrolase [Aureibacter tunicatorum]MDR6240986.1 CubicO group peptidase (beta-lactamase class C family) [Aureibacter tunicatorum]BDD03765.1 hypothetical protein AUTU_12480 [Aureibacter tunicatorum]